MESIELDNEAKVNGKLRTGSLHSGGLSTEKIRLIAGEALECLKEQSYFVMSIE